MQALVVVKDDFASMLLAQGAQLTLHSMREKYPNKAVLRNMIRRVRIAALEKMRPFEQFTAQEIRNTDIKDFSQLNRLQQSRRQVAILKGGNIYGSDAQNIIKGLPITPRIVLDLKLNAGEIAVIKEASLRSIETKSSNVILLMRQDVDKLLSWAKKCLKSPDESEAAVLVAVALVTGRRAAEIFLTGAFDNRPSPEGASAHVHWACFSGQVKAGLRDPDKCYDVPVLAPIIDVQQAMNRIRKRWPMPEQSQTSDVNRRFASTIQRAAKRYLAPLDEKMGHLHAARELYAMVTFRACQPHTYSLHGWIRKVLGHADLDQGKHYSNITIRD